MRYKKIMLIIIIFACLLAVLPVNATENVTNNVVGLDDNCNVNLMNENGIDVIADESMEETSRVDIYFDASKSDAGNGSKENPFNSYVGYGMIQSNANCHFKNGVYQVDFIDSVSNISFYGENPQDTVLDFQNGLIHLKGSVLVNNITFKQSSMYIYDNFSASNSIFKESYRTDFQPLIYLLGLDGHELLLDNCSFVNNCVNGEGLIKLIKTNAKISNCIFSDNFVETQGVISGDLSSLNISDAIFKNNRVNGSAGAIFIRGDAVVSNCSFINNSAFSGGAIFSYSRSYRIIVNDSRFYNNRALIGGALVSFRDDNIQLNNCDFINSSSLWGGTLALFGSHLDIFDCNFENSSADEGGAIYHRYGDLRVLNSTFRNNSGKDDAIILAFLIDGANFTGNDFIDNDGRAIVCDNKNISYQNNNLSDNDVYLNFIPNLFIGSGNYTLLKINDTFDGNLPEKYDPRDYDMVTPLRNQGGMGYCWAFGAMATLESCILKASGMKFDFSEMNLVNLLNEYLYGFHRYLDGGHYTEPISYFLNWFGPVDENDDLYLYGKPVSPIFNSLFHVQNVLFVYMNNSTDWDSIKNAIYRYGAVKTDLLMNLSYFNGSAVYIPNTDTLDHTVSIVGWDDNFPKENFIVTPPGDGAWIVKNSWGESIDDGYLYVSYYDAAVNGFLNSMFTFIFNDTIRLDKNYQYDFGDVMFTTSTDCIFHKNIFNSTDDEYLAAVGTYFQEVSDWDVVVNVNDVFVHSQSGRSGPGFFTINLDKYIPLKKNDKFEIIIKHYALEEGGRVSYPVIWYKFGDCKGKSFFSYDDETWIDVSDNFNRPAVSAIKAYTFLNKINTTITLNADYNDYNPVNITVFVFDEYGNKVTSGNVIFDLAGEKYVVNVSKGIANIVHNFNKGSNLISAKFEGDGYESSSAGQSIDILKIDVGASMNISTHLDTATINVSVSGVVVGNGVVRIGNKSYVMNLTNGFGSLIVGDLENGEYCAYFELENKTYECGVSKNFTASFLRTKILAENLNTFVYSNEKYVISLTEEDVPISGMIICFKIDGREVMATTDSNGQAVMDVNLSDGTYSVEVIFNGDSEHVSCHADATITVNKFDSVISVSGSEIEYGEILHLMVSLNVDGDVGLIFNNSTYSAKTNNKTAEFDVAGLDAGEYEFNIIFLGNEYCLENNLTGSVKVSKATPEVVVVVEDIEYGQYESITVKVNATGSVELSLGDISFSGVLRDGVAIFTMNDLSAGHYDVSVRYLGSDNYNENVAVGAFNVSKVTPGIIILVNDIVYGESCFVTAYIDAEGSVELSLGDICQTNVIENGEVSFTVDGLSAGRHDVSVRYLGGVNYNENAAVSTFYVSKIGSEVSVDVNDTFYGESVVIDVYVEAEGSVELSFGNIYQTKSVSDGKATFTLNNLSAGSYEVTVRYLGDINHSDKSSFACFNVNKITPSLDKTYKNNMIIVSLPQNAMGNVSLEIDNQIIIENVAGGVVNLQLPDLENGNYSYVISYSGDVNYLPVVMNDILNINKSEVITPEVIIPDLDSSDDGFVVVELPADATGTVTLSINGEDYVFAVNDGVSNVNLPELADGDYDYVIIYSGDNKYSMFVKTGTMAVNNTQSNASGGNTSENITVEPEITIPPLDEPSDNGVVLITLPSDATGKVVLSIDGNDYDFVVENGVANVVVPNLANGDYSYTITYSGDAKYNSVASSGILKVNNSAVNPVDNITDSNKTGNGTGGNSTNSNVTNTTGGNSSDINATKIIPEISVPSLNEPSGDESVSVSLPVDATGTLTLTVNGKNYVFAIKDGVCNVELPELANGDYNYTITYSGDGKYSSVAVNGNFAVKKIVSTIIVASDVSVIYNDGYCLVATLKDSGNNAIVGAELFIDLNGVKTQLFSDDNGQVKMPLDGLVPKVYVAAITFEGNSEYEKSSKSVKITVMKAASQIVMGDLSGIAGEKLVISAEVISNNLTVDGGIVSFFDGETEIGSADVNNGGAELTYVPLKEGNYAITAVYGGNAVYKSSNSTVALKVFDYTNVVASNVKVIYSAGSYYSVTVYGADGKLANRANVVITVNGKTFKNLTATKGIAKFKVTNVPGTYKMNITSLGKSVTRTLTVKHLVTLKAITLKKSAKKLTLQATLAKVNGKYLKNKQITFKINGKKVATAKTNSKGVAKVTIKNPNVVKNLKVGKKATYQATYLKDTVKKTTKIKK